MTTTPTIKTRWLTEADAAEYLNLKLNGLRWLRRDGKGPKYYRFGPRAIRYSEDDLVEWVAKQAADD